MTLIRFLDEAKGFAEEMSRTYHNDLVGITDGKAVGTYIEHKFMDLINSKFQVQIGSSAKGIDFPSADLNIDIKTTSNIQPQSSCPFKTASQKIFGLGYNIIVFVYEKDDKKDANLQFVHVRYIDKKWTADFQTTKGLKDILDRQGNEDDVKAFLTDRMLPVDEIGLESITSEIMKNEFVIGYLTISNALQWRLQYRRVIDLEENIDGIIRLYDAATWDR